MHLGRKTRGVYTVPSMHVGLRKISKPRSYAVRSPGPYFTLGFQKRKQEYHPLQLYVRSFLLDRVHFSLRSIVLSHCAPNSSQNCHSYNAVCVTQANGAACLRASRDTSTDSLPSEWPGNHRTSNTTTIHLPACESYCTSRTSVRAPLCSKHTLISRQVPCGIS